MGRRKKCTTANRSNGCSINLPKYVRPYFERLLERTEAESKREYEPYQGSRFARAGEDVTAAQQQIRDISGRGIAGLQPLRPRPPWPWPRIAGYGLSGWSV